YPFLLKGREDLHLDERVMQLLEMVNSLMRRDRAGHAKGLRARHYNVVPVGPRAGLIQWVPGTVPLFRLYKSWQARQQTTEGAEGAAGVPPMTSRRAWPHQVLRSVWAQLAAETPRDLVAQEVYCSCVSPADLWAKTRAHARSLAVMSMVGYVIGLGDRHLDNMLIDFASGEVVHIDWNVCFEKGAKLKVPEVVPYRMTQTLQASMGYTGVEGPFRIACEKVLRVLRRNKETLLTLLEAFVYDPLVDWSTDKSDQVHPI
ncbi:kinase-like domain-containing protein, partial [Baffinella frigidus]